MVIAVAHVRSGVRGEYIGRAGYRRAGSPLGNPARIGVDGTRTQVIAKYEQWLAAKIASGDRAVLNELDRLARIASETGTLTLLCFCAPEACHGDAIARVLRERTNSAR